MTDFNYLLSHKVLVPQVILPLLREGNSGLIWLCPKCRGDKFQSHGFKELPGLVVLECVKCPDELGALEV